MTTLALPPANAASVWRLVWLNVVHRLPGEEMANEPWDEMINVFPWLAPTRVSDPSGVATHAEDIHPAQCFWAMPRRIALVF